jgi:UDPglucose--hexose-1-phosphate uridylyltransferase
METLEAVILSGAPISSDESVAKHEAWFEKFRANYVFTAENTADILKSEIGKTFVCVLEDAGVYKCTEKGREAFLRFVDAVNA